MTGWHVLTREKEKNAYRIKNGAHNKAVKVMHGSHSKVHDGNYAFSKRASKMAQTLQAASSKIFLAVHFIIDGK